MQQVPETVSLVLDVLAEKFGTTAVELWETILRQHQLFAVADAGAAVMLFGTAYFLMFVTLPRVRLMDKFDRELAVVFTHIGVFTATASGIAFSVEASLRFMNPTYYALREIMRSLG